MATSNEIREILEALRAIAQQLGSLEARQQEDSKRIQDLTKTVHIGNGQDSLMLKVARIEERLANEKMNSKERKALVAAIVTAIGAAAATIAQALGAFGS